jgi:hypothetical protein
MSEFEKATGEVNKVLTDYEEMMNKVQTTLQEKMKDIFTAFFNTHPNVKTIHWTQYAPHFNDGEECIFSVNEPHFTETEYSELVNREHAWGEEDNGIITSRMWDSKQRKYVDNDIAPALITDMDTLSSILQSGANEGVMRAMFDTHVWVKAHRGGFDVDDFEHD